MLKTYIEMEYQGRFFSELCIGDKLEIPGYVYGIDRWRFYKRDETTIDTETIHGSKQYVGGCWHYYGKCYSIEEVEKQFHNSSVLVLYMKVNNWAKAVRTPSGKWYEFGANDVLEHFPAPSSKRKVQQEQVKIEDGPKRLQPPKKWF